MADAIFLKIPDVPGDSTVANFADQIEVLSFNHGVSAQVTSDVSNQNRTSGRPMHQDFTLTKFLDKSSPLLNQKCCMGSVLGEVVVTVGRNDAGEILELVTYTLSDVVISSVSVGGGGGGKPVETVSLNYSAITWTYVVQAEGGGGDGNVVGAWDLSENTAP